MVVCRRGLLVGLVVLGVVGLVCDAGPAAEGKGVVGEFSIYRGTNISHWLSQSGRRGDARRAFFGKADVERIAGLGFDHIRLPIDEEQMWDEAGNKEREAFSLLHKAIGWCREAGLRVVVDLHILRSHHFNAKEKPLWTDVKEQEKFFDLWRQLSGELKRYPVGLVAYELMNEAVADDAEDWNKLIAGAIKVVRQSEPSRRIVVGSNRWQSTGTFDQLRVPKGDKNIILSFHFYTPMLITHYKASWTGIGKYTGPVRYPGWLVPEDVMAGLDEENAKLAKGNNGRYDRARLAGHLAKPLKVSKELGLPLYCGEWGAILKAPRDVRMAWYRDFCSVLDEYGIARANWDYKGGFGFLDGSGEVDEEMVGIMVGRTSKK